MQQRLGGTGSEGTALGSGGGLSTGSGGAPAAGVPSTPPGALGASPEMVRAILSGIWGPGEAVTPEAPLSPVPPAEGTSTIDPLARVLHALIARAGGAGAPLSLVLLRPGGKATS